MFSIKKPNYLKTACFLLGLFSIALILRLFVLVPTLEKTYVTDFHHIGTVPWSDADSWLNVTQEIEQGNKGPSSHANRPLYSLLLVNLVSLFGYNFSLLIFAQAILICLSILLVFYLLKDLEPRIGISIFIVFLVFWRLNISEAFMTENLAIIIISIAFACLYRGFFTRANNFIYLGCFFLGLSEAVRPWAMISLFTAAAMPLFMYHTFPRKIKFLVFYMFFIFLGYSLHPVSSSLFMESKPSSYLPVILYSKLTGVPASVVLADSLIVQKKKEKPSPEEFNKFIYKRAFDLFKEEPKRGLVALYYNYRYYFFTNQIGYPGLSAKSLTSLKYSILFLMTFLMFFYFYFSEKEKGTLAGINKKTILFLAGSLLFLLENNSFWTFIFMVGFIHAVKNRDKPEYLFLLLYFVGILLSIPFVGSTGQYRVKLVNNILFYLITALGFSAILDKFRVPDYQVINQAVSSKKLKTILSGVTILSTFLIFLGIPYLIKSNNAKNSPHRPDVSTEQIANALNLEEQILTPSDLDSILSTDNKDSYQNIEGKLAFKKIRYINDFSVPYQAKEGVTDPDRLYDLWPLLPADTARIIYSKRREWIIFPNLNPAALKKFEKQWIIVVGRVNTHGNTGRRGTKYAISASQVGYLDSKNQLEWLRL